MVDEVSESARTALIAEIQTEYSVELPADSMPPPINASLDEIAWSVLSTPPKKESE